MNIERRDSEPGSVNLWAVVLEVIRDPSNTPTIRLIVILVVLGGLGLGAGLLGMHVWL